MQKVFNLVLDLIKPSINIPFSISQDDLNSIVLNITVQSNGQPFVLTGLTPRIFISKPDGTSVFQDGTITDAINGIFTVTLSTQSYSASGNSLGYAYVYNGTTQVGVSSPFSYLVDTGNASAIVSTNDWTSLNTLFNFKDYVNVKAFGAKGDGSSNDTAALQNIINNNTGKIIFFPIGVYMVDGLSLPTNTYLLGVGKYSVLKLNGGLPTNNQVIRNADYTNGNTNITLDFITLDGNQALYNIAGINITGTQFQKVTDLTLHRTLVRGGKAEGIYVYNSTNVQITNVECSDNGFFQNDASGLHLDTCDGARVSGLTVNRNGYHGLILTGSTRCTVDNVQANSNGFNGVMLQIGAYNNSLSTVSAKGNARGLYMLSDAQYNSITGGDFYNNTIHGIAMNNAKNNSFTGCRSYNNAANGYITVLATDINYGSNNKFYSNTGGNTSFTAGSTLTSMAYA